ncbi:glutamyl-tRNA(Gln) amidotransferase subunit A [Desulfosarcina alkanivorans]|uniref:Glutamyl-tRNA(Gln) amidotransferase subunit A n=1 Tax=Desulfosarcina alkanivorans TaxID=571177 RepID=A0A5K7YM95_9BACT|nr:Asp-tRNA(Asn)/Glu-tRNA(Gln) amidotransferase subunit GatA [Desulfosarcina alkanivorans]BBO69573.1 glutamyl-tRNA(Gln) amidotransferase subunit A [Desulfosarcina alkanivorans]
MKLHALTIKQASGLLKNKEISSVELTRAVLDRIDAVDGKVGAYLTVDADGALDQAQAADHRLAAGDAQPLTGIPLGIKDLMCTRGLRTTCASKMLENFVPPYDATVVTRLKNAGAVIVGKLNMDEFAMGSTTEHSGFQVTRNPWNLDRIPGGSSGGSAAAVSADMCLGALGSDTGGSIRQPASHCGVVGIKPTYGRVSRFGLVAFASSLDQIGPLGKTVADCAIMLDAIAGHDPKDSTSVAEPVPAFASIAEGGLADVVVGIPKEFSQAQGLDPQVGAAVERAVATIESLGARCIEVSLPHTDHAVAAYYVIAPSEASSNLARYDGVKYGARDKTQTDLLGMYRRTRSQGFGAEVQRRIILGTYALSAGYYDAYYGKASQVRTLIKNDFQSAFASCDAILSPVAPTPAYPIGATLEDPLTMYLSDIFTLSANLAGIPGISVPCGFSDDGLPIGLQVMGRHFNEAMLFKIARAFEAAQTIADQKPPIG